MAVIDPSEEVAVRIGEQVMGWSDVRARRFTTGMAHYVYEVTAEGSRTIVVRLARVENRQGFSKGLAVHRRLRDLGVPVPEILADGTDAALPFVVMERLAGTDLTDVVGSLSENQLRAIAREVVRAQARAARFGSEGRHGYAPSADVAPHETWTGVVEASLSRSRQRIAEAGLFGSHWAERTAVLLERHRSAFDRVASVPFLHDATIKNVIVAPDGRFSGIVDVDDLCFGDPRYAPALTRAALLLHRGQTAYVDFWMAEAGYADDALFRFYVVLFVLDLMSEHGQRFNGNETPSDPEIRRWLQAVFETEMERAEGY